jgi:ABC-type sugar transport system substrate-binding protein
VAKVVVGLLNDEQDFQKMQAADARSAAARAGLEVEVVFAESNAVLQIQQLFRFVHAAEGERPAAIVVETVTGEGLERVARNAVRAGIGWLLLNGSVRYVEALRAERPDLPVANVAVDNVEVGRIQARQARALAAGVGPVLCVTGPADTAAASERLTGLREALGAGHDVKVLNGDWTESSGEKAVAAWLRLKTSEGLKPCVVVSQNDAMAVGARRAIRQQRPEWADVPYTGCDGLPDGGQRLVRAGELAATVVTPTSAGQAVTLVGHRLAGQPVPAEVRLAPRSFPAEDELARRGRGGR